MNFISKEDRNRISEAIENAEQMTSGEIVAVIAVASDDYFFIPILWAALIALAVPFFTYVLSPGWSYEHVYLLQLAVFAVLSLIVQWRPLRIALVPNAVKRARAHRHAVEQFLAQNLHTSKGRTGVLIFVSAAERFAEIIADEGIYEKVPPETWDDVVSALTAHIEQGRRADGFVRAIGMCEQILAEHFPPGSQDDNELPNHLIVIE